MATVNKNFRVKNGLVVEGSTATVNGQNILVEGGSDNYIVSLIGGQATSANTQHTVVKRDENGNFAAGNITVSRLDLGSAGFISDDDEIRIEAINGNDIRLVADDVRIQTADDILLSAVGDVRLTGQNIYAGGSDPEHVIVNRGKLDSLVGDNTVDGTTGNTITDRIATAKSEANSYADSLGTNYDEAGAAAAAQAAAENYANSLAVNYDAAGSAQSAYNNAVSYVDGEIADALNTAQGYATTATSNANSYTDGREAAITTAYQNYADNLVNGLDTDDIEEGSSNLYFTNGRARNAVSAGTGITYNPADGVINVTSNTYDAYGAASDAEGNANAYTDNAINALDTDDIEEGSTNKYFSNTLARNAFSVTPGMGLTYDSANGLFGVDTNYVATNSYVDSAISNLVDGAPGLLDTLNEIAAAINDDENYFTTVANSIAEKVSKSGDTMTGALVLHADPVNNLEAATKQYVDQAESDAVASANSYTDGAILAGNAVAEPVYAAIDFNGIAKNVAASVSVPTAGEVTAYEWNHSGFTSGKFTVKVASGTHTELSEILVTTDTSNNVHFTEYGMVGTNGSLSTISADFASNKIRIRVTTLNNNSTVVVAGTLIGQ